LAERILFEASGMEVGDMRTGQKGAFPGLLLAFSAIWFANGVTAIIQARIEHASHQRRKPTRRLRHVGARTGKHPLTCRDL
jgi:hypothetical protein